MQPAPQGGVDVAGDLVVVAGRAGHRLDGAGNVFVFDFATLFTREVISNLHNEELANEEGVWQESD